MGLHKNNLDSLQGKSSFFHRLKRVTVNNRKTVFFFLKVKIHSKLRSFQLYSSQQEEVLKRS